MKSSRENDQRSGRAPLSIFVDANIIVSGLVFAGNEALLLKLGTTRACNLLTTSRVMAEVEQTLRAKEFRFAADKVAELLSIVNRSVRARDDVSEIELKKRYDRLNDKKDIHVLAAFEVLRCDILVTGDKELVSKVGNAKSTKRTLQLILREEHD